MVSPKDLSLLFKALAHPERVAILQLLQGKELCVCELEKALDLRQAYVSQQLTVLREAGLVCFRKDGWNVLYRISRPEVYALLDVADTIQEHLGTCAVTPEELASDGGRASEPRPGRSRRGAMIKEPQPTLTVPALPQGADTEA